MTEPERNQVLAHSPSSISISMNSLVSNNQRFCSTYHRDAKGWATRSFSLICRRIPGVMHPYSRSVQNWNRFSIFSCFLTGFLDSLFLFLPHTEQDNLCITVNGTIIKVLIGLRSLTNFIYLLHMLLKFRLAYAAPKSRVLMENPKTIALHYLSTYFLIDLFVVLPLSQVIMWMLFQKSSGSLTVRLLQVAMIFQYITAMFFSVLPMVDGQSTSVFKYESWLAKFVMNLLGFILFSHVVGSCWYHFSLERVNECLRNACGEFWCLKYIYCEQGNESKRFDNSLTYMRMWKDNENATACFVPGSFHYGIYVQAVSLMTKSSLAMRYSYSLFWGFQQISVLAGNQTPAFYFKEIFFTMFITATGLVLFSLLIGNMQNFLHALGRRSLEMSIWRRDVEEWMSHRLLPQKLRKQVRECEKYSWSVNKGLNDSMILESLPEDLQIHIRRHLFNFVEKLPIFAAMDDYILDAIRKRFQRETYIKGSRILVCGCSIDKIVIIAQGTVESIGENNDVILLSPGAVCGEELIELCKKHSALHRDGKMIMIPVQERLSKRTVTCLSNVEAFTLKVADLVEVTSLFSLKIKNPQRQGATNNVSPLLQRCKSCKTFTER